MSLADIIVFTVTACAAVCGLTALKVDMKRFTIMHNKRCISNVTGTYTAFSAIECAGHCAGIPLCYSLNFNPPMCEILHETVGGDCQFLDEVQWQYLRK